MYSRLTVRTKYIKIFSNNKLTAYYYLTSIERKLAHTKHNYSLYQTNFYPRSLEIKLTIHHPLPIQFNSLLSLPSPNLHSPQSAKPQTDLQTQLTKQGSNPGRVSP